MYYQFNGNPNDMHSFFEIDPWTNSSYNPAAMYDLTLTHYNSIYHSNNSFFIAATNNTWFRKSLPIAVPLSDCFSQNNLSVSPIPSWEKIRDPIDSEWKKGTHNTSIPVVPIETLAISVECSTE